MDDLVQSRTSETAKEIASFALKHFDELENRGKPREGAEWTIFAAIVAEEMDVMSRQQRFFVVSSATGSKCFTGGPPGWCLRDMHAEVLAKRGLQRVLRQELMGKAHGSRRPLTDSTKLGQFRLRDSVRLHMYISDAPCGDASIYKLQSGELKFTGSKLVLAPCGEGQISDVLHSKLGSRDGSFVGREKAQRLGALRTKSGRSNIPQHLRSTSMSCSDKLVRWGLLGLQGAMIVNCEPVRLSSVVVGRDPQSSSIEDQKESLERSLTGRIMQSIQDLERMQETNQGELVGFLKALANHSLSVHVVEESFRFGKNNLCHRLKYDGAEGSAGVNPCSDGCFGAPRKRQRKQQVSPCGFSINWNCSDDSTEVVVGARGVLQGKKPKSEPEYRRLSSRLCRQRLCSLAPPPGDESPSSYRRLKEEVNPMMQRLKRMVLDSGSLKGWIEGQEDFSVELCSS